MIVLNGTYHLLRSFGSQDDANQDGFLDTELLWILANSFDDLLGLGDTGDALSKDSTETIVAAACLWYTMV